MLRLAALACLCLLLLAACDSGEREPETTPAQERPVTLDSPQTEGLLRVATRNGSTTYYLDRHERPIGPEYDLVEEFADAHGWEVEWTVYDSTAAVLQALDNGTTHLAAAGLTHQPSRNERFTQGPAHTEITQQLVCHRSLRPRPDSPEDLAGLDIHVTAESSYVQTLTLLQQEYEGIEFTTDSEETTEILLSRVAEQAFDCAVADSNIVRVTRRYWPHLVVAMDLTEGENLGWYLPRGNQALANQAREWMNSRNGNEALDAVESRYYTYISEFDFVDLRALNRRIDNRLPTFRPHFIRAEEQTGMPADLLAALAYQESHWDPDARSPTGVRGIMMLTGRTADALGVNRLDPEQAIEGGARYLAKMYQRLPEHTPDPDRTFLALASYNIGRGHLLDARQLARDQNKSPNSWSHMREVLPLKADPRFYPSTRYGYARGYEPVHYVQRIRNYRDVISEAFE